MSQAPHAEPRRLPPWAAPVGAFQTNLPQQDRAAGHIEGLLDTAAILGRVGNNPAALPKMIQALNQALESYVYGIEHALKNQNAAQLTDIARTLKMAIGNFSVKKPYEAAQKLEDLGRSNHLADAPVVLFLLKQQIYMLQFELIQFEQAARKHVV